MASDNGIYTPKLGKLKKNNDQGFKDLVHT